jgi:hypothetical protein
VRFDITYIALNLRGAWRVMLGRREGLSQLDISEGGFWRSLQSVLISFPVLILSWSGYAREIAAGAQISAGQAAWRIGLVDICAWFLPLFAFALAARRLGLAARFVHYFVATNWASALLIYLMLPVIALKALSPQWSELNSLAPLVYFGVSLVLTFRLTHVTLNQNWQVTLTVFLAMLLLSFIVIFGLQDLLGIAQPPASSG